MLRLTVAVNRLADEYAGRKLEEARNNIARKSVLITTSPR